MPKKADQKAAKSIYLEVWFHVKQRDDLSQ